MYFTLESLKILEECNKKKVWFHVDQAFMSLVNYPFHRNDAKHVKEFNVGVNYSISSVACKGFEPRKKVYKMVGDAQSINGVDIDSIIVKQVSGNGGNMYTLTKEDCEHYDVEYEDGLILMPKNMNWRPEPKYQSFDPLNLAASPISIEDGRIHHFMVKVSPFKNFSHGYVITPSGMTVTENSIKSTIRVKTKKPIVLANNDVLAEGCVLKSVIETPRMGGLIYKHGNFISSDDSMYIHIFVNDPGIDPEYIDGVSPYDMFDIMWDEGEALSVDEAKSKVVAVKKKEADVNKAIMDAKSITDESIKQMIDDIDSLDNVLANVVHGNHDDLIKGFNETIDFYFNHRVNYPQAKLTPKGVRS